MNERRFRSALEAVAKTIHSYGEDEIFAALGVIAERFGWELTKQPDPCCDFGWHYERQGIMVPIHECPRKRPDDWVDDLPDDERSVVEVLMGRVR